MHSQLTIKSPKTLLMAGCVLLGACTVDNIHSAKSIKQITSLSQARSLVRPGMTMDQVKGALGNPTIRNVQGNQTVWSYEHKTAPLNKTNLISGALTGVIIPNTKSVMVVFNASGRVSRVNYFENTVS